MSSSSTNDMNDDENSHKCKASVISPGKDQPKIELTGDNKSTGSNGSQIPSTTTLSTKFTYPLMGNKDQDDSTDPRKTKVLNLLLPTRPRIWRKMPTTKN